MRSKKGFTLIELLAVVVILAVIALIATPIVLNIIEKAKKSAFLDSAYGIVKSGENYYAEKLLDGTGMIEDKTFLFDEGKPEELRYSGTTPNGGTITITKDGKVGIAIHNGTWCATKSKDKSEVNIAKYEDGKCLIPDMAKDPVITLHGKKMISLKQGAVYQEEGAIARTVDGTPLSYQTEITKNGEKVSNIDTSKVGDTYKITYTAESNGKKASVNRTVTVIDMTPVISFTETNPNYVKSQNVAILVSAIRPNTIDQFTYQIDEGEEVEVSGTNTAITLKETGEHRIKVTVRDNKGYEATKTSNIYKIDATGPTITFEPETVTLKVNEVANYNLYSGVNIKDNVDGDIVANEENVKTTGELKAEIGTHNVTYEVNDKLGNKTSKVRTFNVVEAEEPILNFSSMSSDGKWIGSTTITATANDVDDLTSFSYKVNDGQEVSVPVNGKSASVEIPLKATGIYTITLKATGKYNNSATLTSGEYKIDTIGPTITFNPETVTLETEQVAGYNLLTGVTVNDNVDGPINVTTETVKTTGNLEKTPKDYTITYEVKDKLGNISRKDRIFHVVDQTKPSITITPNEQSTFVKTKTITISASDNVKLNSISYIVIKDGVRGASTSISNGGTVTVNSTGNYQIEVMATDSGNNSTTKTSGTYKIDTTVPIITFSDVTLKTTEVATYNLMTGVSATDNSGINPTVTYEGGLSATVGTQKVTYKATDEAGNIATKIRTFHVVEAEGPILNFSSISSNGKWIKAQNIAVTATDNSNLASFTYEVFKNGASQGVQNVTVSGKSATATVLLSSDGTYTIKLKATDQYGSNSETTSGTYKIDVTKPTISMSNVTIYDNQASSYNLMTGVSASDNSGVTPSVTTSGTITSTPKAYTITYTVTDEAGNVTTANRTITVKSSGVSIPDKVEDSPETNTNDPDGNRRYVGANPKNYVRFNNELWRIIGIFNGQAKIIRNDFYSTGMAWDSSSTNNWTRASLKTELNGTYLNSIEAISKSYIDQSHVWNLGGHDWNTGTRADFYNKERGTTVYSGHLTIWTGAIGLMYPSDWAYASSSTSSVCDTTALWSWNGQSTCYTNSWLHNSSYDQWTLTPCSGDWDGVFYATRSGGISWGNSYFTYGVRPVLYLKSSVKITGGSGTSTDPFILGV